MVCTRRVHGFCGAPAGRGMVTVKAVPAALVSALAKTTSVARRRRSRARSWRLVPLSGTAGKSSGSAAGDRAAVMHNAAPAKAAGTEPLTAMTSPETVAFTAITGGRGISGMAGSPRSIHISRCSARCPASGTLPCVPSAMSSMANSAALISPFSSPPSAAVQHSPARTGCLLNDAVSPDIARYPIADHDSPWLPMTAGGPPGARMAARPNDSTFASAWQL